MPYAPYCSPLPFFHSFSSLSPFTLCEPGMCEEPHRAISRDGCGATVLSSETGGAGGSGETTAISSCPVREVLARHRADGSGPPYISLRLPDVVGPRDSTYRLVDLPAVDDAATVPGEGRYCPSQTCGATNELGVCGRRRGHYTFSWCKAGTNTSQPRLLKDHH